ncbi:MAG TPA: AtpZ/AtpI family protein [Candidatus Moranbacteria bacterium]|nr:AtpZ/AtpI family protein [Candidatus Moranbacteria bacterium]
MEDKNKSQENSWSALSLAWSLGYSIAVPLVVLALIGRFLDKKMGTSPWMLLLGIIISIAVSSYMVYKKSVEIINNSEKK